MSYKNDSELVIANKYGAASSAAKAELYETYDKLTDLTVGGNTVGGGAGFGKAGSFLVELSRLLAPGAFMPYMGQQYMSIPGTSFSAPVSGGNGGLAGSTTPFGIGNVGVFPGFPSGNAAFLEDDLTGEAASILDPLSADSDELSETGAAASLVGYNNPSSNVNLSGALGFGSSVLLPMAGLISGIGGVMSSMAPYMGEYGIGGIVGGNLLQGTGGALAAAVSHVSQNVVNNADITLSNKVRNIETVVKMLDAQADVARKMLKNSIEGDKKSIDGL